MYDLYFWASDTTNLNCPPLSHKKITEKRNAAVLGIEARVMPVLLLKIQHSRTFFILLYDTLYIS